MNLKDYVLQVEATTTPPKLPVSAMMDQGRSHRGRAPRSRGPGGRENRNANMNRNCYTADNLATSVQSVHTRVKFAAQTASK